MNKHYATLLGIFLLIFSGCEDDKEIVEEFSASVGISATPMAISEDGGSAMFTITMDKVNTTESALSIPFTLSGTATSSEDYSEPNLVAQIEADEASTTIIISITDDSEVEENETIVATLGTLPSGITASSNTATLTIQDDDTETFSAIASISSSSETLSEGDGSVTFTITLDKENTTESSIVIPLAISGTAIVNEDYTTSKPEVLILAGEISAVFELSITDDSDVEEDETIIVSFGALPETVIAGTESVTVTIEDNDVAPFEATVDVAPSETTVSEGNGTVNFTITLSQANTTGATIVIPFELSGTATSSEDYTPPTMQVEIANDETSASIAISINDDSNVESDETIIMILGSLPDGLTAGTGSATVTIQDNDQSSAVSIVFGNPSGSTIWIDSWTDISSESYLVVINSEDSFSEFSDQTSQLASTTYVGYGEQVVYNGTSIGSFEVSLLSANSTYYLKVIPKSGSTYDNSQNSVSTNTNDCVTTSTTESQVCFDVSTDTRTISSNQLANHDTGNFPNADPTAIQVTRTLDLSPDYTGQAIYVYDETGPPTPSNDNFWQFGIATNGVEFHPMGLKPWENPNSGEENWEWQAKVTDEGETHLDAYGAHVTSQGNYHYHGDITGLANEENGSRHSLIYGFAADGFPIYYKYGYSNPDNSSSAVIELTSSYRLKSGSRTGTGTAGEDYPDGTHDGTYIQDYEYVSGLGDLDECNGRTGVTPEFPDGTYYYVITSDFPVTPNCFFGTPADDWKIGK